MCVPVIERKELIFFYDRHTRFWYCMVLDKYEGVIDSQKTKRQSLDLIIADLCQRYEIETVRKESIV